MAKPKGLGLEYAAQFDDASVVAAYEARPPYPESLVALILEATGVPSPRILDLGCGTGELTRRLAASAGSIVAVDRSPRMVAAAKASVNGCHPNIAWIVGDADNAPIAGPFDLAIAAESFHWFDWPATCARIGQVVPSQRLLIVEGREEIGTPWADALAELIAKHSTNREFEPYDLVDELVSRGLFTVSDRQRLGPEPFTQSVEDYIRSIHSRNGFSLDRMSVDSARAFDTSVRAMVMSHARPRLTLQVETRTTRGTVQPPG